MIWHIRQGIPGYWLMFVLVMVMGACSAATGEEMSTPETTPPGQATEPSPTTAPPPETAAATPTLQATATSTATPLPSPTHTPAVATIPMPTLAAAEPVTITSISMLDTTVGWAIGGRNGSSDRVLHTGDGGQSWRDVTPPEPAPAQGKPNKIAVGFFLDTDTGWVTYHFSDYFHKPVAATVWRTGDGGRTWQSSEMLAVGDAEFYLPSHIWFVDSRNGWLLVHVGAGMQKDYVMIFKAANGGQRWQRIIDPYRNPDIQSCDKTGMEFADAQTGLMTKDCHGVIAGAFIHWTHDGGLTWQEQPLPSPSSDPGLFESSAACGTYWPTLFSAESAVLAVKCVRYRDDIRQEVNFVYRTADAGQTWQATPYPGGALQFVDAGTGWALTRDIYKTEDGGQSWTRISAVDWDGQFSFVNQQQGWAVARSEAEIGLVHSADGGQTWQLLQPRIASQER